RSWGVCAVVMAVLGAGCSRTREVPTSPRATEASSGDAGVTVAARAPAPPAPVGDVDETPRCEAEPGVTLFSSPRTPVVGRAVRVLAVSEKPLAGELRL